MNKEKTTQIAKQFPEAKPKVPIAKHFPEAKPNESKAKLFPEGKQEVLKSKAGSANLPKMRSIFLRRSRKCQFVVDVMLGSLSTWLRILGFDTLYRNDYKDIDLIKISLQEERILLTRDHALARSKLLKKVLLIKSENIKEQIKEVISSIKEEVNFSKLKPRCPICNGEMQKIDKLKVNSEIPDYVNMTNQQFFKCKECGKVYWNGTHKNSIEQFKKEIFKEIGLKGIDI